MNSSSPMSIFVQTRQHYRFVEVCETFRKDRSIAVCTGKSGVGKTASANYYSGWPSIEPYIEAPRRNYSPPPKFERNNTAVLTAELNGTVKRMQSRLAILRNRFNSLIQESAYWHNPDLFRQAPQKNFLELILIDDAHRLSSGCLEAVREFSSNNQIGIVLIAMQGFDRKIKLHEYIDSKVGLYHQYKTPRPEELRLILSSRWRSDDVTIEDSAITVIEQVTSLNVQKAINIQAEIERVRRISSITIITPDLVKAASAGLLLEPATANMKP